MDVNSDDYAYVESELQNREDEFISGAGSDDPTLIPGFSFELPVQDGEYKIQLTFQEDVNVLATVVNGVGTLSNLNATLWLKDTQDQDNW